ncbi:hypothetical protein CNYM01_08435 [Colletotrichum nymphaeae SA-01]|uniref:Uncharacterized protein n=1 Tax=Colletotrichum nymphaeae SA-01 TaxID=1460502 RepID=A0A135UF08_9PEZI|nr:hypothetical protein CNYM01_08435 [Colletotrichum nymphaeae SA-01]
MRPNPLALPTFLLTVGFDQPNPTATPPPLPSDATPWIPRAKCLHRMGDAIIAETHCGDKEILRPCFLDAPSKLPEGYITQCLLDAGCGTGHASMEDLWITVACLRTFGNDWIHLEHPDDHEAESQLGYDDLKFKREEILAKHNA